MKTFISDGSNDKFNNNALTVDGVTTMQSIINVTINAGSLFNLTNLITTSRGGTAAITEIVTTPITIRNNFSTVINANISRHYADEGAHHFGTLNAILLSILGLTVLFFGSCMYVICMRRYKSKSEDTNCDQDPGTSENTNGDTQSMELLERPFRNLLYVYPTFIKSGRNEISTTGDQVRATCKHPGNPRSSTIILTMSDNLLFVETEEHLPINSTVPAAIQARTNMIFEENSGRSAANAIIGRHQQHRKDDRRFTSDTDEDDDDDDDDDEDFSDLPEVLIGRKLSRSRMSAGGGSSCGNIDNEVSADVIIDDEEEDNDSDFAQPMTTAAGSVVEDKYLTPNNTGTGYAQPDLSGSSCSSGGRRISNIDDGGSVYPSSQMEYRYDRSKSYKSKTTAGIAANAAETGGGYYGRRCCNSENYGGIVVNHHSTPCGQSSIIAVGDDNIDVTTNVQRHYLYEISSSDSEETNESKHDNLKQSDTAEIDNDDTPASSYKSPSNTR